VWDNTPRLAKERGQLPQFIEIRKFAVESKQKAVELEPTNTTYLSGLAINKQNLAFALNFAANQPPADQTESRALAEKLLAIDHLTPLARFNAYTIHANSHVKVADSLPWYTKAIEAEPYDDVGYLNRARNLEIIGEHERAADDRARADKLRRAFVSSLSAWMLATASDDSARDGNEALRLATLACELTEYEYYAYLRSLAAAHAELGNFAEATSWAAKALELGPPHEKSHIARQLRSYRNNQPWRE
jgi:tetratricopeptide (TPR) repeat protein